MKILVICYEYPPIGGGGGRVAAQTAKELVKRGHEVRVLTGNAGELPADFIDDGVTVHRVSAFRKSPDTCSVPEMVFYLFCSIVPGWRMIRSWRPDVFHVHFAVPSGAVAWILSMLTGIPYILTAHLGDVPGGVPEQTAGLFRWIKPFTIPIWKRACKITAVSRFVAGLAETAYHRKPEVIHNGLVFTPISLRQLPYAVRFLYVGRISVQKNLLLALQALVLVRDLPWHFEIVGDGPLREDAEAFVCQSSLEDRVSFSGWLDADAVEDVRKSCSVLLIPSLHEGLPMAAVEALAAGLAIVGTDIPGLADVVESGKNGFLTASHPPSFALALRKILETPSLLETMRGASLEKALDFQMPAIMDRYESVLQAAIKQGS